MLKLVFFNKEGRCEMERFLKKTLVALFILAVSFPLGGCALVAVPFVGPIAAMTAGVAALETVARLDVWNIPAGDLNEDNCKKMREAVHARERKPNAAQVQACQALGVPLT
jgi:hypothetical protein